MRAHRHSAELSAVSGGDGGSRHALEAQFDSPKNSKKTVVRQAQNIRSVNSKLPLRHVELPLAFIGVGAHLTATFEHRRSNKFALIFDCKIQKCGNHVAARFRSIQANILASRYTTWAPAARIHQLLISPDSRCEPCTRNPTRLRAGCCSYSLCRGTAPPPASLA
jgi:hypothetical protein